MNRVHARKPDKHGGSDGNDQLTNRNVPMHDGGHHEYRFRDDIKSDDAKKENRDGDIRFPNAPKLNGGLLLTYYLL
jgi:hypothetical protein